MASLQNRGSAPLGYKLAAHLLRRATYNISKSRIEHFATLNVTAALDELLDYNSFTTSELSLPEPVAYDTGTPYINSGSSSLTDSQLRYTVTNWFMEEARKATTLQFKLAVFLHANFVATDSTFDYRAYYDYVSWLLCYSKESYKELAYKITYDNRMLIYLSNQYNHKNAPNENYAREFLELFTITKGEQIAPGDYTNYTELDVRQAARVLTGYRRDTSRSIIDIETGIPTGRAVYSVHDVGNKTFSHAFNGRTITGATSADDMFRELHDFVDMVFDQDATAKNICRKLYRFFVRRNIDTEVENDIIIPLAIILKNQDYNIEIAIRTLLSSQHFYDEDDSIHEDEIIGALVKPPFDLLLHSVNLLEANIGIPNAITEQERRYHYQFYLYSRIQFLNYSDMYLFRPLTVAGYKPMYQDPDYDKQWFSFNTLEVRYSIGKSIIDGKRYFQSGGPSWRISFDVVDYVQNSGNFSNPRNAETLINEVYEILLVETPESFKHEYFFNEIFLRGLSVFNWMVEWDNYISTGNSISVKGHLEDLFTEIMASIEYQVF